MQTKNFKKIADVQFPAFAGVNINMMPFVMGDPSSIPGEYRHYTPIIEACGLPGTELGKVGYLSITETVLSQNASQRRGGIHVEKHPQSSWGGGGGTWGGTKGGLYMASTVDRSCRLWDEYVENPGPMGDCEIMRGFLGEGVTMNAGELFWLHDSCPHESLVIPAGTARQWIRVVTSEVGLWYKQHSTPNRLGVEPDCRIVEESKF